VAENNLKLSEEFDNEKIQHTLHNIAMSQEEDQLRCSIIDNKDTIVDESTLMPIPTVSVTHHVTAGQTNPSIFNQMFE
jgi:hypothetical protein